MKNILAAILLSAAAFGQDKPPDVTATYTMADISRVAKQIYLCGKIEGVRKSAESGGKPDVANQAAELAKEAGCEEIDKLLETLEKVAQAR